jgi:mono/diheme cytochrome c family protein
MHHPRRLFGVSLIVTLSCLVWPAIASKQLAVANDLASNTDAKSKTDIFLGIEPDAQKGFDLIMNKPMGRQVLSVADIDRLWTVWEPAERAKAEQADPAQRRTMTFERYGWVKRVGDQQPGLPLGYTADSNGMLFNNCFSCHGGKVAGVTIPGMGNTHVDLTTLGTDVAKLRVLEQGGNPDDVDFPLPFPVNYHKGFTNAVVIEVLNYVRLSPEMLIKVALNPKLLKHHDMNPPAWWTTHKKDRLYVDAFSPKTPRQNMPFARNMDVPDWEEKWHALEPDFVHIYHYIDQLAAPPYPFPIDHDLAASGRKLFERHCAECHGTYGENPSFPNVVVPIDEIGTDPVRLTAVPRSAREFGNANWMQYYGEHPIDLESTGYLAPPLDGLWASAPYFHNGAAPTLTAVMNPSQRPKVWKRSEDGYDQVNVGLEIESFDQVPEGLSKRVRRMYYDTSHVGNSAAGHAFPDKLSATEKLAVIEYLKTL